MLVTKTGNTSHCSLWLILLLAILYLQCTSMIIHSFGQYVCLIDSGGIKGNITFTPVKATPYSNLKIEAHLDLIEATKTISDTATNDNNTSQIGEAINLEWSILSNSLDYDSPVTSSCSDDILGSQISKPVWEDKLIKLGDNNNNNNVWIFNVTDANTDASQLIWGRSLRVKYRQPQPATGDKNTGPPTTDKKLKPLTNKLKPSTNNEQTNNKYSNLLACCNIFDTRDVKTAQAVFTSQIGGRVVFRGNQEGLTLISSDLYHIRSKLSTRQEWKILASDILDDRRHESECRYLQVLFDPNNVGEEQDCKRDTHNKCRMGDLTKKHGLVNIAGLGKNTKSTLIDKNLPISALEGSRSLFLAIFEQGSTLPAASGNKTATSKNIVSCAQIVPFKTRQVQATIQSEGVSGWMRFRQRHFGEPTYISYDIHNLEGNVKNFRIHELPNGLGTVNQSENCSNLGKVFNPYKVNNQLESNPNINKTLEVDTNFRRRSVENFEVGSLDMKHGRLILMESEYEDHYAGELIDLNLPLFGRNSIIGRSLVINKNNGDPWLCATIDYFEDSVKMAVATFYYPIVGRITFRQLSDDSEAETSVLVELHNVDEGVAGDSFDHNWQLHLKPALADFYNWSSRCESVGEMYDPFQATANLNPDQYSRQCRSGPELRCRVGDLAGKANHKLMLTSDYNNRSVVYYHDMFLPLGKRYSIIGRSVVVYDEKSPTQRGNRLACATIKASHPLKASVKFWNSGPSIPSLVQGSVTFRQESTKAATQVQLDLTGLEGNVENYGIHDAWSMEDKEFPCSNDSVYDIFDPYDQENSLRLPPTAHFSPSQTTDQFKVGDLSKKHGLIGATSSVTRHYTDANLPLFASKSIVGRSMVLRTRATNFRWVCGNIELDYDRHETRELVGVASFDDPRSNVAGYVRFRQLEHKDGSLSDTWIQLDLRTHNNGAGEFHISYNHNWAVYVNQVGADAYNTVDNVRCIASGFKWNPYLAQDKSDTYKHKCTIKEPLTCAMGDLGLRHGYLTLGPNNRQMFSDSNLPLVGNYSIMGRSLIIFDNRAPNVKLACANIFPDIHLLSNVVIKRNPSFTVAKFIEQMRSLLGAADWLIVPELRATKLVADGECVQMTIHFYGQKAHQLQIEVNNLITFGHVRKTTRHGTEKISTHFKLCRTVFETSASGPSLFILNIYHYFSIYLVYHAITAMYLFEQQTTLLQLFN